MRPCAASIPHSLGRGPHCRLSPPRGLPRAPIYRALSFRGAAGRYYRSTRRLPGTPDPLAEGLYRCSCPVRRRAWSGRPSGVSYRQCSARARGILPCIAGLRRPVAFVDGKSQQRRADPVRTFARSRRRFSGRCRRGPNRTAVRRGFGFARAGQASARPVHFAIYRRVYDLFSKPRQAGTGRGLDAASTPCLAREAFFV